MPGYAAFRVGRVTGDLIASETAKPSDSKATATNASKASVEPTVQGGAPVAEKYRSLVLPRWAPVRWCERLLAPHAPHLVLGFATVMPRCPSGMMVTR